MWYGRKYVEKAIKIKKIMDINDIIKKITKKSAKYDEPDWEHKLTYDSMATVLEPMYYWILDFMESAKLKPEKLEDNFTASPGSAYFSEIGARASVMQDKAMTIMKLLSSRDGLIANVMSLIDELRIREMQLKDYEDRESSDKEKRKMGLLALKRRWVDEVDKAKGPSSILEMTRGAFPNIRNYFDSIDSAKEVDSRKDFNEIVKKILKDRLSQFEKWEEMDKSRTLKLYKVGKGMLRSQVNNINLYVKWLKPYLKAAQQLQMAGSDKAALVNIFDVMILELELFGKKEIDVHEEVNAKHLPEKCDNTKMRKYYACLFVNLGFRSKPTKRFIGSQGGGYAYAGKLDIKFRGYALNEDEIALLKKEIDNEDMDYVLNIAKGFSETGLVGLDELKGDIDHFLLEEERKEEEKEKKEREEIESNPFVALGTAVLEVFGLRKVGKKKEKEEEEANKELKKAKEIEKEGLKKDKFEEKLVRDLAREQAKERCFGIYNAFKKTNKMLNFDPFM